MNPLTGILLWFLSQQPVLYFSFVPIMAIASMAGVVSVVMKRREY